MRCSVDETNALSTRSVRADMRHTKGKRERSPHTGEKRVSVSTLLRAPLPQHLSRSPASSEPISLRDNDGVNRDCEGEREGVVVRTNCTVRARLGVGEL